MQFKMSKTVLFLKIQFSIKTVYTQLNDQTILFQTIQFSISTQFSFIWSIDRTLSNATTPAHSGSGSNGNEGILRIPQRSSITGTSPWDCLVSYLGHSLVESYQSAEMQSVYLEAHPTPADWARMTHIYPKVPECFMSLISLNRFWFVCIFVGEVKY